MGRYGLTDSDLDVDDAPIKQRKRSPYRNAPVQRNHLLPCPAPFEYRLKCRQLYDVEIQQVEELRRMIVGVEYKLRRTNILYQERKQSELDDMKQKLKRLGRYLTLQTHPDKRHQPSSRLYPYRDCEEFVTNCYQQAV